MVGFRQFEKQHPILFDLLKKFSEIIILLETFELKKQDKTVVSTIVPYQYFFFYMLRFISKEVNRLN